jgi:branched-chain amino acid transport system permease protein/neutral amino acid transport system permease protein
MSLFIASLGFGLITAAVLAISAVGFTMQFAITNVLNLSYSGVMISAAFVAYGLNSRIGLNIWIAMIGAGLFGSALSYLLNRLLFRPFQRRNAGVIGMVIVTLAVGLILQNLTLAIGGPDNVSYKVNNGPSFQAGSITLTALQLGEIGLAALLMLAIHSLLKFTRLGKAMRATAANMSLARASGIRTERVITVTWLITGFLCGVAGTVFAMDSGSFGASSISLFLVVIIAAVVVGGVGQPYGAMAGALMIGLLTEASAVFIPPDYKEAIAFVILLLMLALRPQGLIFRATRA